MEVSFSVRNDGPGSARLDITGDAGDGEHQVKTLILAAGEERLLNGFILGTVQEWASGAEVPSSSVRKQFEVEYSGPGDHDVDVVHRIIFEGSMLMPTPEHGYTYQLKVGPRNFIVEPSRRLYWRSRAENQQLEVEYPSAKRRAFTIK